MTIKDDHAVYGEQRWIERKMRLLTESITDEFMREGLLVQRVRIISHLEDAKFLSMCSMIDRELHIFYTVFPNILFGLNFTYYNTSRHRNG